MREIIFRGKCARTERFVYGYLSNKDVISTDKGRLKVIPETIGQFTGLLDKNGNKIFEGDILKARAKHVIHPSDLFKIKDEYLKSSIYWCPSMCAFEVDFNGCLLMESNEIFEIIGNIHDVK